MGRRCKRWGRTTNVMSRCASGIFDGKAVLKLLLRFKGPRALKTEDAISAYTFQELAH